MTQELQIYIDGKYYPKSEAKLSVYDHGLLYGDGVFEGIRAYIGQVFKLKEHVARLYESAHAIMLQIPLTQEQMVEAVVETLRKNNMKDLHPTSRHTRRRRLRLRPANAPNPQSS
jgi:branched-chain amino acid aminotransferase